MKTWQKAAFIIVLIIFVAASVTISLISISRPPYKYEEQTAIGENEELNGWVFKSFNGNAGTKTLFIDFVRDKNGNGPDETKPVVAVAAYAVNADEYVHELIIGKTVQHIEETSFFNLKKLQKITVDPENRWYRDIDGVLFTKDGRKLLLYPARYDAQGGDPAVYVVPDGVERVATFAFLKNKALRDLTLPSSLREIGDMTFFGCGNLGGYAYNAETDTLSGTGFVLPDGLEKIGSDAFSKCSSLAPVLYLPASVKEIGHHAFFNCTGLKQFFFGAADDSETVLGESWLPKNVKVGPMWKAPKPEFGKTRADSELLTAEYQAERLQAFREEAQKNG